ncbi:hypothetical protein F511_47617 [Dorcoceras hygrometricum]|uniref:Uncharacterized protein n=1 Tax=Dorcoceras hygrometricum TaxID=472368 RepID=A0A2Z6ZWT6_9LAMI|nr:hypothetical protein F511_47617 [Dorcoceras hygrometricum]
MGDAWRRCCELWSMAVRRPWSSDMRRSLRAAVRRAWRDVVRGRRAKFCVAPPPAAVAPAKLRRCRDG